MRLTRIAFRAAGETRARKRLFRSRKACSPEQNELLFHDDFSARTSAMRPGARKHPKLACAERIVNARIAEVWVGIEDPDPTVDRQGIRYLEQHGIKVQLFDLDLQEQIRLANKEFIAQAFKRAADAKDGKAARPSPLSR